VANGRAGASALALDVAENDADEAMPPVVLIIEPRREVAAALEDVVASAHYIPIVRPYVERLADLGVTPAAIIVRIAFDGISEPPHASLERFPIDRPPVVAIVWEETEMAEARRLKCDVILRAPGEVGRLCDALARVMQA
jgi:hypothetical protein